MGWSSEFVQAIGAERVTPIYVVEAVNVSGSLRGTWRISTTSRLGDPIIAPQGIQGDSGTELTMRTWRSRIGSWSVMLQGNLAAFIAGCTKGQLCRLLIGFPGWPIERFQAVALGQVWNIIRTGDGYRMDVRDIESALRTRLTTTDQEDALFDDITAGAVTTVASTNYTTGLGTLSVADSSKCLRQDDGSSALKGVVRVTPTSGDPFFGTFTGVSGNDLTGFVGGLFGGGVDANAAIGQAVETFAFYDDHPLDMLRRVLLSTGAHSGTWDWGRQTWGYGLDASLVDHRETNKWRKRSKPASGTDDWEFVSGEQTNGLEWLASAIAPGGFFWTVRQGQIAGRCVLDPYRQSVTTDLHITDADIARVAVHEYWDSRLQLESNRVQYDANGGSTSTIATGAASAMPAQTKATVTLDHVWQNASALNTEVSNRLSVWHLRLPERLGLVLRGWRLAQLAIGDIVPITSRRIRGRLPTTRSGYVEQRAMVTGVSAAWFGADTRVGLAVLPDYFGPFDS